MSASKLSVAALMLLAIQPGAAADAYTPYDGMDLVQAVGATQAIYDQLERKGCTMLTDGPNERGLFALCPPSVVPALQAKGLTGLRTAGTNAGAFLRAQEAAPDRFRQADFYAAWQSHAAMNERVEQIVAQSGGVATLEALAPVTHEGREIKAVRLRGKDWVQGGPRIVYNFNIHAREWITGMSGVYALEKMVEMAKSDVEWLAGVEMVLVPISNPDGFEFTKTAQRMWRKNRSPNTGLDCMGTDLNRNWDVAFGGASKDSCSQTFFGTTGPRSEPESQALASIFSESPVDLHIDVHAFQQAIFAPWSHSDTPHPRAAEINVLTTDMAAAIKSVHNETYTVKKGSSMGTFPDWSTNNGAVGLTYEVRPKEPNAYASFAPNATMILPCAEEVLEGLLVGVRWVKAMVGAQRPPLVAPLVSPAPQCAPGCLERWIGDGWCDAACNVEACGFDNTDCDCVTLLVPDGDGREQEWVDSDGEGCLQYQGFCESDGTGRSWIPAYAVNGISAFEACCTCGGGIPAEDAKFHRYDNTFFRSEESFVIESTKKNCLNRCLDDPTCSGVDYGFGICYGKSHTMTSTENMTSENFFHFEKKVTNLEGVITNAPPVTPPPATPPPATPVPPGAYELMTVGTCVASDGYEFVQSKTECSRAAGSLGLDGSARDATSATNPLGCYWKKTSSVLYYNPSGDSNDTDTDRVSVCKVVDVTNVTNVTNLNQRYLDQREHDQ